MEQNLVIRLDSFLKNELGNPSECWIASAMITENAFRKISSNLDKGTKQNYIVGIGLPTPPSLLETFHSLSGSLFKARIYLKNNLFHPKVYVIKKSNDQLIAYVGSANLTDKGLSINNELGIRITDQNICLEIIEWFNRYYNLSEEITIEFIERYKSIFNSREEKIEQEEVIMNTFISSETDLEFLNQFFKKHHFEAFRNSNWEDYSTVADQERYSVVEKFVELHNKIYPKFFVCGLNNLKCHYVDQNITSSYFYKEGFTSKKMQSIWLHYGKDETIIRKYENLFPLQKVLDERNEQSFINHIRIQIIIHHTDLGIWLVMKDNSCMFDRQNFKNKMEDPEFRVRVYQLLRNLDENYSMRYRNNLSIMVNQINTPEELHKLTNQMSDSEYFIISKAYKPLDSAISDSTIESTILNEFVKLYPIYDLIRDKRFG